MRRKSFLLLAVLMLSAAAALTACGKDEEAVLSGEVIGNGEENPGGSEPEEPDGADDAAVTAGEQDGADAAREADGTEEEPEEVKEPVKVKGIYVTGPVAGTERMDELIGLVEETELNAMVIDIKNDEGKVTYKMQSDMVLEAGSGIRYIQDMDALMEKLRDKDIYLIARIVAFKDPYLAEKKPELSLKTQNGSIYRDRNGEAWVNPYKKEVWDYLMEIGTQAAALGFDEIQFDYIRFSTDGDVEKIDYGTEAETKTKEEVISEFTEYAYETLKPLGVAVSADVFGTVIDSEQDAEIVGQNYQEMASHLDYICPMVYPSHYRNGVYGIEVPDKAPYDTVYQAMKISREKLEAVSSKPSERTGPGGKEESGSEEEPQTAGVRVWLQDFTASWLKDHLSYGAEEVRAQIQAVYDAGYEEWILWNAKMNYTADALLPYWEERPAEEPEQTVERKEEEAEEPEPEQTTEGKEEEAEEPEQATEGKEEAAEEAELPAEGTTDSVDEVQPPAEETQRPED